MVNSRDQGALFRISSAPCFISVANASNLGIYFACIGNMRPISYVTVLRKSEGCPLSYFAASRTNRILTAFSSVLCTTQPTYFSAMPFLEGLGFGLATVILIGPVFFTLLKAALEHGARGGVLVALGIICSDLLIVLICLSGVARVLQQWIVGPWMAIAAGALLAGLGIRYLIAPQLMPDADASQRRMSRLALFASGFVVNFINPFVFAVWLGLVMHAAGRFAAVNGMSFFLGGALAGILITDLAKALLAPRLKPILSPATLKRVHAIIGIALIGFGLRALVHAAQHWD